VALRSTLISLSYSKASARSHPYERARALVGGRAGRACAWWGGRAGGPAARVRGVRRPLAELKFKILNFEHFEILNKDYAHI
jgi:hypothetical protein